MPFAAHGFLLCFILFVIDELDGKPGTRVFAAFSRVVRYQPFFEAVRPSAVICAVRAFQKISIHDSFIPYRAANENIKKG